MDFNALQHKLFELDPSDPKEDLRKLAESASSNAQKSAEPAIDYVQKSAEVAEGSLEMDRDYSVNDFAALAGVTLNEAQKTGSAGQAKGKDPMPKAEPGRTKHPLKDKLVGEDEKDSRIAELEDRVSRLESMLLENNLSIDEDIKAAWKAGKDNYNKLSLLKKGADAMGGSGSAEPTAKGQPSTSSSSQTVKNPTKISDLSKGDSFKDESGMVWYYNPREQNWRSKNRRQTVSAEQGFKMWMKSQSPRKRFKKEEYTSIKDELWARLNEFSKS